MYTMEDFLKWLDENRYLSKDDDSVDIFEILKNLTLIKKYAFEKNDERIYLCADYIEKELHKVMYGDFVFEKEWHK